MHAEKFELLEARIRETALLVSRLREEKRQLEQENEQLRQETEQLRLQETEQLRQETEQLRQENEQLRERLYELEEERRRSHDDSSQDVPNLDSLLQQLETLHTDGMRGQESDPVSTALQELLGKEPKNAEEHFQLGTLLEQKGQFEQAITAYQRSLDVDAHNLVVAQRLAFLLEKLNRDAEASPLWDKIWAMREAQSTTKRRRMR